MKPPGFWAVDGIVSRALSPFERITGTLTARRLRRPGWVAPVPVVCCGNAGVGGAGKTTLVLDLAARLVARGVAVHCLTRGYGGKGGAGPILVEPDRHDAGLVGDEALLLARIVPCWVGADRAASARAAIAAGAGLLLMDDGLQNPGLVQDMPLLTIDGAVGFGNGRLLPAGPLREPVAAAASRVVCAVLIGPDRTGAVRQLPPGLTILRAELAIDPSLSGLQGTPLLAFAGIARPEKFFDGLRELGLTLAGTRGFADHHRFRVSELARLHEAAGAKQARLITTAKDAARLSPAQREGILVATVSLSWSDLPALDSLLDRMLAA